MTNPYDIITIPHPTLKQHSNVVENINDDIKTQIIRMKETLEAAGGGVGLAANQVDITNRVLLADFALGSGNIGKETENIIEIDWLRDEDRKSDLRAMVNPEIIWKSEQRCVLPQGCLSIPGQYADIIRPMKIKGTYINEDGKKIEFEEDGLTAQIIQHEIDHLNGTLFIDHLSSLKRNMIVKRFKKSQR